MSDTHQFEAFMQAYQNMVYTTAVRLLGTEADAKDVSQEVFLKAYERFEDLHQSTTAGGWLKTVTTNLCLNHLSRYRFRWRFFSEIGSEEDDTDFLETLPSSESVDQTVEAHDRRLLLEKALRKLPEAQRVPLVLYHFEDLSYEEIAARLRVSVSKVKTDIHRGRLALAQKLKHQSNQATFKWQTNPILI